MINLNRYYIWAAYLAVALCCLQGLNPENTVYAPWDQKVQIYNEYHGVFPLVGMGTLPPPLSPASVPLPP
jgi:hypothetical protein